MDETKQTHLSSTKPETFGAIAKRPPPDPAGPSYPCHEDVGHKDRCWSVPVAMAAAAFFLLLPQSCFGLIFVHFMAKFGVNRENASWPQNVASMVSHLAGIPGFFLEQFLSSYKIVLLSAVLSSLALIGSAFSPNMAWMTVTFGLVQGVVSLCVAQGIAQGYGLCIKYVLVADFLGIERTAVCFGMYGVAMAPLSLVSPRIIGSFRDAKGSYDGFYQTLGAVSLAAGVLFGAFALWHRVRRNADRTNIDLVVCPPERF
ncbi:uncharacterized protein LOC125943774 isoform X2 [Dermacentor silvarum]|uniref:uncharacterized protein LOC125943774 isoform X2 n=1 Tax=Dermacentor silvarum TaxID=543639 RepID=UPI002100A28D|nr:uncharacterized protein LOC125943774 isoform X2 [Dermacentor silvarum]